MPKDWNTGGRGVSTLPFDPARWAAMGDDGALPPESATASDPTPSASAKGERACITRIADVEPQPVEWLWPGRIPLGMLTVLDGDPGLGKSTVMLDLAARLSRGEAMPDGSPGPEASGVVILSAEDDPARTIRPRLDAAGADVQRIVTMQVEGQTGALRDPDISAEDLEHVEQAIREVGAKLAIFDPLMAYLPADVNAHRDQDVRRSLAELRALAERTRAAVVVVRHLNKNGGGNSLYRGGGSIGIIGAARSGLLLARDPDDAEARVLAAPKCNLAATPPSLRLRLVVAPGAAHPTVAWEGTSAHSADSLLALPVAREERGALEEAADFLRDRLGKDPAKAREVESEAWQVGISRETLRRARRRLRVVAEKVGQPGEEGQHWRWRLPAEPPKEVNPPDLDPLRATDDGKPLCEADDAEGGQAREDGPLRMTPFGAEQSTLAVAADEWDGIPGIGLTPEEVAALGHQPPGVGDLDGSPGVMAREPGAAVVARPAESLASDPGSGDRGAA